MFRVAPRGSTKEATCSETLKFSRTFFIVTGRVPAELVVVNAVIAAGAIPLKNCIGLILLKNFTAVE